MNKENEDCVFKTATGKDWRWNLTKPVQLPVAIKQECEQCGVFVPINNMENNPMGLQEGDLGLCVRNDIAKIVTISYRKTQKCQLFNL